jgi:predicted DNA-binding transcriptional regulator YafY
MLNALIPELDFYRIQNVKLESPLEKLLFLSHQLKYKRRRSFREYARILRKSERQVRRDVETLEKFFDIDKDEDGRPFIFTDDQEDELSIILTQDEIELLITLISGSRKRLAVGLRKKLKLQIAKADEVLNTDFKEIIQNDFIDTIKDAIHQGRQLKIFGYENLKSKKRTDKIVEPISISQMKYLTAFDTEVKMTKNYVIMRMNGLVMTDEPIKFKESHQHLAPDTFGMNTGEEFNVKIQLSHLAYTLMVEEYPQTDKKISLTESKKFPYMFTAKLNGLQGIGRFVLGLPGEVKISKPKELIVYVEEKAKNF